jgi:hypothetical protein
MSTARITKPLSLNSLYSFAKEGISLLHQVHQVAQKSIKTILPRKSSNFKRFPSMSSMAKLGALTLSLNFWRPAARMGSTAASDHVNLGKMAKATKITSNMGILFITDI